MVFKDRFDAGRFLAEKLAHYRQQPNLLVLGLPRGGVPVAFVVAEALDAPLDVFLVRKIGLPGHEEMAIGAVADGGVMVLHDDVIDRREISRSVIRQIAHREQQEIDRQDQLFRQGCAAPVVAGQTVILVDDGLATGATMRAAVTALRSQQPARLVVAVPVGAPETCAEFSHEVDEVICATRPEDFRAVGVWYRDFAPTPDEMVVSLLATASARVLSH